MSQVGLLQRLFGAASQNGRNGTHGSTVGPADLEALVSEQAFTSQDGVGVSYQALGKGDRTIILADGLGGHLHAWEPLVRALLREGNVRILTWDYRGLFKSETPRQPGRLSIPHHARDAREMMEIEGVERASLVGWSMGVQVGLEMASLFPEALERLVLINGTHGHVLQTGFQPLLRLPFLPKRLHALIELVHRRPWLADTVSAVAGSDLQIGIVGRLLRLRNPLLERAYGKYVRDVFQNHHFRNYLRLFQELDAHSVYHHLPQIEQPTLVISGQLDPLTPAYQSKEMARRLPNARQLKFPLGTHFVLLEYPKRAVSAVLDFLRS